MHHTRPIAIIYTGDWLLFSMGFYQKYYKPLGRFINLEKMELVVDTLSKKSEDLSQLFIPTTFCRVYYIPGSPVMDTQMWMPSTNKDRKSLLPITEVQGCACKKQVVYTAAPHTLQHTSVLFEAEDTERESEGSEAITMKMLHPSANEERVGQK